mmetsp:Transcript_31109/g.75066  ORF Transcript_31109/g.75066 Transcript_31109/m.75066 type:complete len:474 (-) Transcript_31109:1291-2712(-)
MASVEVGEAGGLSDEATLHFQFHHIQAYVDSMKPLEHYKKIGDHLNQLARQGHYDPFSGGMRYLEPNAHHTRVQQGRRVWESIHPVPLSSAPITPGKEGKDKLGYVAAGQDFVEQLIVGLGWRVTAEYVGVRTRSLLVTSSDARGVKFVVTSLSPPREQCSAAKGSQAQEEEAGGGYECYDHFDSCHVNRFLASHDGRQGFAVLGFEVGEGECDKILARYMAKSPELLVSQEGVKTYRDSRVIEGKRRVEIDLGSMKVLDVFAYHSEGGKTGDNGTVLRFVERKGSFEGRPGFANPGGVLPGLCDVNPTFDGTSIPAYSDHWVSNVLDREGFLTTLEQTLGFAPKVDFNAGVIAAGDAIIESTVIGNTAAKVSSRKEALSNQAQVYLPVNNALSSHGHVASFIRELGQGVQHIASRVDDLVSFVERVNNYRSLTVQTSTKMSTPNPFMRTIPFSTIRQSITGRGASKTINPIP